MIRIVLLLTAVFLIICKLNRINKRVLCAKAYLFILEIKKKKPIEEANYKANLFDFFKKQEAKAVFYEMKKALDKDYNGKMKQMIYRAETWGFFDTHTKIMFKKRKRVKKILEKVLLAQDSEVFSGNATELSREMINKYWDINALLMASLDDRICALKLLLEQYTETKEEFYIFVAISAASSLQNDAKFMDKEDLDILNEWNNIVKKQGKKK